MVPVIVWAIASNQMQIAFSLFLIAGLSDLVDGFLAKRFGMATELGAYLDPLADKAMIVSIYVALGINDGERTVLALKGIEGKRLTYRPTHEDQE